MPPFFSIITAVRDGAQTIPALLHSLEAQRCRDFECIIQDGSSEDATVAVVETFRDALPALSLESRPDGGIYDAWNRALRRASGRWVLFLGADDALVNAEVLERTQRMLQNMPMEVLFAAGEVLFQRHDGTSVLQKSCLKRVRFLLKETMPICHSGLFTRRELLLGEPFDSSFRIAGDQEFLARTWKNDAQAIALEYPVTYMAQGGISSRMNSVLRLRLEQLRVARRYFSNIWTLQRCIMLLKTLCFHALYLVLGEEKAAVVLDRLRCWRGLEPVWGRSGDGKGRT